MKRILAVAVFVLLLAGVGSAQVIPTIAEVNPDSFNRYRDSRAQVNLYNNETSTESFTTELNVTLPNGTTVRLEKRTGTISGRTTRNFAVPVPEELLNTFGEYHFMLREENSELNDTLDFEIVPDPINTLNLRNDEIWLDGVNTEVPFDLVVKSTDPQRDEPVFGAVPTGSDLVNFTVYRVEANGTNTAVLTGTDMVRANQSETLTVMLNESFFEDEGVGYYRYQVNYVIQSPGGINYTQDVAKTFEVNVEPTRLLSAQLAGLLAVLLTALLFTYVGVKMRRDERGPSKIQSVLRTFYIIAGQFFLVAGLFLTGEYVGVSGPLAYLSPVANTLMYAGIIVVLVLLLTVFIVYIKRAVLTAAGEDEFDDAVM